jgi:hypothetical protein
MIAAAGAVVLVVAMGAGLFAFAQMTKQASDPTAIPTGAVTLSDVNAHEEAHLYYPGAVEFSRFGDGEGFGGHPAAFAGAILTSADSPEKILDWYEAWATDHGWRKNEGLSSGGPWIEARGWRRGDREFFLAAIDDPDQLANTLGRQIPPGGTVFEASYTVKAAST